IDELLRIRYRQVAQHHRIHHAEDRSICADAQRQREHRNQSESRCAPQLPQRVSKIFNYGGQELGRHLGSPPQERYRLDLRSHETLPERQSVVRSQRSVEAAKRSSNQCWRPTAAYWLPTDDYRLPALDRKSVV